MRRNRGLVQETETIRQDFMTFRNMEFKQLQPEYDSALAEIIKDSLKENGLDIPGTAYYDESLGCLSSYYRNPGRVYYVLLKKGIVIGGIGVAEFDGFPDCCELQKLYLRKAETGKGLSYEMIRHIEYAAKEMGYRRIYLETHTNLKAAMHVYEKAGYVLTERSEAVVHGTMNRFYLKELQYPEKEGDDE